jgi:hypothetical protein
VYLLVDRRHPSDDAVRRFATMAREDNSALVRMYLASALQRVPVEQRWEVLAGLYGRNEDAGDQNQPLMIWFAAEPVVTLDMNRALDLASQSKLPKLFSFTVQRIAAVGTQNALRVLSDRLGQTEDKARQRELADGIDRIVSKH